MSAATYPAFYTDVPVIRLYDPLADFLGAAADGIVEYSYLDAVKLAGHSCPTVAATYGMTRLALLALYGDALPERGGVRVTFSSPLAEGVTGVMANVASLLTGAASEGGFKGLGGRFVRRGLLDFSATQPLSLRFTRLDNGSGIDAATDFRSIPAAPEMGELMQRAVAGSASAIEQQRFRQYWQDRVRRILVEHGDDLAVFILNRS